MAAWQSGIVHNEDLWPCGFSRPSVMRLRGSGLIHEVHPGVYAWGHSRMTLRGRFVAVVRACGPGAAVSHRSAAVLWGLLLWDETWRPEVTTPMRGAREIPDVAVHRTRVPMDTVLLDDIPVTIVPRVLVDLSSAMPFHPVRGAVREAMAEKKVTVRQIAATRGKRGGAQLICILAHRPAPSSRTPCRT